MEQVAGDFGEKSFDLVDPGEVRGGEVQVKPGVVFYPGADAVVVTDHVYIQAGREVLVDLGQEFLELHCPVSSVGGSDHGAVRTFIAANRLVVPCRK